MHLARPLALGDLLTQIGQPDFGAVAFDQGLLVVLPRPPALLAGEPDQVARMIRRVSEPFMCKRKTVLQRAQDDTGKYRPIRSWLVKHFV